MSQTIGFGFMPDQTSHSFVVHLPAGSRPDREVAITEEFQWSDELVPYHQRLDGFQHQDLKVLLSYTVWSEIAEEAKNEFNRRLIRHGKKSGRWPKSGMITIDKNFGKELVLLCWAVEDADPLQVPNTLRNWLGLSPEERWWLYTMTNAATGQALKGRNKGWRKAVRFALCENPIADSVIKRRNSDFELDLFGE
ncbi:hypothetical protein B4O97_13950 [Marispirochaeta aestuarii]|uniref:DUF3780 domain-containing protein n=1 Tax=Marispirochaeta aestuarii TaxID=1963862 RepID=A0A1Y1RWK2_9SPIO|nr:DUF3780 domain-containing protein [Marispirochaeta aestuarii]ORC33987.1 hypothetical protein B4O97_13950 [Marispirochaeta aestuarii]